MKTVKLPRKGKKIKPPNRPRGDRMPADINQGTIVATLLSGLLAFIAKLSFVTKGDLEQKFDKLDRKLEQAMVRGEDKQTELLTLKEHNLICENTSLKFNQAINDSEKRIIAAVRGCENGSGCPYLHGNGNGDGAAG
jgi:hypothetical protein